MTKTRDRLSPYRSYKERENTLPIFRLLQPLFLEYLRDSVAGAERIWVALTH